MRIIHLSDLHLGDRLSDMRYRVLRDDLLALLDSADDPHLVIITGDLVNSGTLADLEHARALLNPLIAAAPVRLCPGNHDFGNFWATLRHFARNFYQVFGDLLGTTSSLAPVHPSGSTRLNPFPLLDLFDEVALIGLDSVGEELHWFDMAGADGELGKQQLTSLNRLLDHPQVTRRKRLLYLHHHPFHALHALHRLKDADDFVRIIQDRVDILLFGHNHHGSDYSSVSSQFGIPLALDASSSTAKGLCTDRLRYRIIDPLTLTHQVHQVLLPDALH